MQRFYDITSGSVMLDGVDIRDMPVQQLRAEMGYVSQEPVLFEGTIRWNLLVSNPVFPSRYALCRG
jgi:ABC-type multidrug transport system fused ATPase/permease subunit